MPSLLCWKLKGCGRNSWILITEWKRREAPSQPSTKWSIIYDLFSVSWAPALWKFLGLGYIGSSEMVIKYPSSSESLPSYRENQDRCSTGSRWDVRVALVKPHRGRRATLGLGWPEKASRRKSLNLGQARRTPWKAWEKQLGSCTAQGSERRYPGGKDGREKQYRTGGTAKTFWRVRQKERPGQEWTGRSQTEGVSCKTFLNWSYTTSVLDLRICPSMSKAFLEREEGAGLLPTVVKERLPKPKPEWQGRTSNLAMRDRSSKWLSWSFSVD